MNSRANGNAVGDYSFHMAVTDFNAETKKEIKDLVEKEGITSFKTFMAYKGALMIDDRQMIGLMEEVKKQGRPHQCTCHQWGYDRLPLSAETPRRREIVAVISLFIAA